MVDKQRKSISSNNLSADIPIKAADGQYLSAVSKERITSTLYKSIGLQVV